MNLVHILDNPSLADHSTMRLGGRARYLAQAGNAEELTELVDWAQQHKTAFLVIGQGSNIVWRDEGFEGLVILNKIFGQKVLSDDGKEVVVQAGAGMTWDELVAWSVDKGLSGIEFLSAIPGTVGAAPVQNIGAYGAEIADTLVELEAYDTKTGSLGGILKPACDFSYRNSRFKSADKGRFIITAVTLKLKYGNPQPPFYESLQNYLTSQGVTGYTPKTIREAVIAVRKIRLPDPSVVNNNGSFFTNPIVDKPRFMEIQEKFPDIKGWPMSDDRIKLAAGWMVEKAGFKDVHDQATGMATWPGNALVMVNEHARSTADLLKFKQKIVGKVNEMFGVALEQEPELLP
jgi:UDP-N-acetylmuramate dehydrogenase